MANKVKGRTVREFQYPADIWGIVEGWAAQAGYELVEQDQFSRTYKRGVGFWVAPQMVKITFTGQSYRMEAWVWFPVYYRIFTLFLMPEELRVESGGVSGVIPRNKAREQVNALLQALGQPPIL
jgi:hypothetical protein